MATNRKPIKKGDKFGDMVATRNASYSGTRMVYQCCKCGHKRSATANQLQNLIKAQKHGGCIKCSAAKRFELTGMYRFASNARPVQVGKRLGCMEAMEGSIQRGNIIEFRCVDCGAHKRTSAAILANFITTKGTEVSTCQTCRAKSRELTAEQRLERLRKYGSEQREREREKRSSLPSREKLCRGSMCKHPKTLICVDPGGVEIWRCRECEQTGEPAWYVPRARVVTSRGYKILERDDASFENAVRLIEDTQGDEHERLDDLEVSV